MKPNPETCIRMLYYLKLARSLEERIELKLYRQGRIVGGVFVSRGQEAVSAGTGMHMRDEDVVAHTHRDMTILLMKGIPIRKILAQYMGRRDGYTAGRDGNLHFGDPERNVIAFVSHLGDNVPVSAGAALGIKLRGEDRIVFCLFGDGASSRGDWHEGMNLASVRRLPVVYVCNNNQYAFSTPVRKQMAVGHVAERAQAYGIPAETVDGNDVVAVYRAVGEAAERARSGEGPSMVEGVTFRMAGHAAHDDASYVPRELLEEWGRKDPIDRFVSHLTEQGIITDASWQEMQERISREIDEGIAWAEASPLPDPAQEAAGVYHPGAEAAGVQRHLVEERMRARGHGGAQPVRRG